MKTIPEIQKTPRLQIVTIGEDGGMAYAHLISSKKPAPASVVFSFGGGWDHVSVSFRNRTPTWEEMAEIKKLFFKPEETCVEYHPAESEYVNNMPYCLHIWRPQGAELPTPPTWMVGAKNGQTITQALRQATTELQELEMAATLPASDPDAAAIKEQRERLMNGMKCKVLYGGTKPETLRKLPMPRLCLRYGAEVKIAARSGRSNILYYIAQNSKEVKEHRDYIIQYGINLQEHEDILLGAVAAQTRNLPDEIDNLVMTCGSGITAIGVIAGIKQYKKKVRRVHLVATAPDRQQLIHSTLQKYGADRDIEYHDLFHTRGFSYEEPFCSVWGGIKLHPNYEAKTMAWFAKSGLKPEETLFWITGAEPTANS